MASKQVLFSIAQLGQSLYKFTFSFLLFTREDIFLDIPHDSRKDLGKPDTYFHKFKYDSIMTLSRLQKIVNQASVLVKC
jgi:hypothetical protein